MGDEIYPLENPERLEWIKYSIEEALAERGQLTEQLLEKILFEKVAKHIPSNAPFPISLTEEVRWALESLIKEEAILSKESVSKGFKKRSFKSSGKSENRRGKGGSAFKSRRFSGDSRDGRGSFNPHRSPGQSSQDGKIYKARIFVHKKGYAFLEKLDVFIPPKHTNSALTKDLVECQIISGTVGKVVKVLERYKREFVIQLQDRKGNVWAGISKKIHKPFFIKTDTPLNTGDVVLGVVTDFKTLQTRFLKKIGSSKDKNIEILSMMYDYGVNPYFSKEVLHESDSQTIQDSYALRQDLEGLDFFTIDPKTAKDHDDAVAVTKTTNGFTAYIAIADVWSVLKDRPKTYGEAKRRGFSLYYLDSVVPMLPPSLSAELCSLHEGQKKLTLTVQVSINNEGEIDWKGITVFPSTIIARHGFNYFEVNNFLDHGETGSIPERFEKILRQSEELSVLLSKRPKNIDFDLPTTKFDIDDGNITGFKIHRTGRAEKMIENLMVLANESVAKYIESNKLPTIYRAHEGIDKEKSRHFINDCAELGFPSVTVENMMEIVRANPDNDLLKVLFMRTLKKAYYTTNPSEHFGLNLHSYSHFTSPIRRFADVLTHQILWSIWEPNATSQQELKKFSTNLEQICDFLTKREIGISELEREIHKLKTMEYFKRSKSSSYSGVVRSKNNFGYTVYLQLGVEVFVRTKERKPLLNSPIKLFFHSDTSDFSTSATPLRDHRK